MKNILLVFFLLLAVAYARNRVHGQFFKKVNVPIIGTILCSDFDDWCPYDYKCILWEDDCDQRPCRVHPICRPIEEVIVYNYICRRKGCSEEECVLMDSDDCNADGSCHRSPNCTSLQELNKCRGYICPNGYGCEVQWRRCMRRPCPGNIYCFTYNARRRRKLGKSRKVPFGLRNRTTSSKSLSKFETKKSGRQGSFN